MEINNNTDKNTDQGNENEKVTEQDNPQPQDQQTTEQDNPQPQDQQTTEQDNPQPQDQQTTEQDNPQPQKKDKDAFLSNLFAVTEEVSEKKEAPENITEKTEQDEYYRATDADRKFLADMLVTSINFLFNFTILELAMKLGNEQIEQLKLKDAEKDMLNKAYLRMIKQYELADKMNPFVTFLIANFMVYGRITKDAIKLKKATKEKEQKQKEAQVKVAKKVLNTEAITEALNEQKIIPINEVAKKYLKKDTPQQNTQQQDAQDTPQDAKDTTKTTKKPKK